MKKSLLIIAIFSSLSVFAQQDPQMTFWMFDRQSFNPGGAGLDPMNCLSIFYRDQWDGFNRDPKTTLFNYSGNATLGGVRTGLGVTFFNDVLGQEKNNVFRGSVAPKFDLNGHTLSIGLNFGMMNKKLGASWVYIDPNDASIPDKEIAQTKFDLGFGAVISQENKYYFGVSVTHLTSADFDNLYYKSAPHIYVMGGYDFPLSSMPLVIRTNALVKTDLAASPAIDLNVNALYDNMIFGGVSFRPGDAISPMVGFQTMFADKISAGSVLHHGVRLGYAYDVTTSEIRNYSSGSHELFVTYCFSIDKIPMKIRHNNPRFL